MTASFSLKQRLPLYAEVMRLNRPIGIYLLLWPTLWAVWIAANGKPSLKIVVIFSLGVVLMRSAGCVINDWADRNFDGQVTRIKTVRLPVAQLNEMDDHGEYVLNVIIPTQTLAGSQRYHAKFSSLTE